MALEVPITIQGMLRMQGALPAAEESAAAKDSSLLSKISLVASYAIMTVGFILLSVAFGMFIGCSISGFCVYDISMAQALFMCGLAATLGGFTLQNAKYQGELQLKDSHFPFAFTLK